MTYKLWTRYSELMLKIVVTTSKPETIVLEAFDAGQANTYFTRRTKIVNGQEELYIRMPLSPNVLTVNVYNKANGNKAKDQDASFNVTQIKKEDLEVTIGQTKMDTLLVKNFVAFAQKFCYNCGWYKPNREFTSTAGNFKIEYLPYIISSDRKKMATPARISTQNGRIQVSSESFVNMTVPMRMAILCHEFSHYYVNTNISDEVEADLNGLTIYLGLGYPIREAYEAFGSTFANYATKQNEDRFKIIDKYIREYIAEHNIKDVYAHEPNKK